QAAGDRNRPGGRRRRGSVSRRPRAGAGPRARAPVSRGPRPANLRGRVGDPARDHRPGAVPRGAGPPGGDGRAVSRNVVVTGGAKGIGRAVVERFAAAGDSVVALGRDRDALETVAAIAGDVPVRTVVCDVTDQRAVIDTFAALGEVDVLVNNAGIAETAPLARTSLQAWERHFDVNATGPFLCMRAVVPGMRERGRGAIVTAACPTFVRTEMTARSIERIVELTGRTRQDSERALAESSPLGRLLEPDEVADAVVFLASPAAASINGEAIVIEGGGLQA